MEYQGMQLSQLNVIKTSTRQWTLFVSLYNKIMDAESNKISYTVKAPQKAVLYWSWTEKIESNELTNVACFIWEASGTVRFWHLEQGCRLEVFSAWKIFILRYHNHNR